MKFNNKIIFGAYIYLIIWFSGCDGSEKTQFALFFKSDIDNLIGWIDHPSFMRTDDAYSSMYVCRLNGDLKKTYPFNLPNNQVKCGSSNIVEIKVAGMIYFQDQDGNCSLVAEIKEGEKVIKVYEKQFTKDEIKTKNWTNVELIIPIKQDEYNKDEFKLSTYFRQNGSSEIYIDDFIVHYRD